MELSRRGLIRLAGATGLTVATGTVLAAAAASPAQASQNGWRWCRQCQGLWFAGNATNGACPLPATSGHSLDGSGNYTVPTGSEGDQAGWTWCKLCQGLWYSLHPTNGVCPARPSSSVGHERAGSGSYSINKDGGGGQDHWRWCQQCEGLWFSANGVSGACPAVGGRSHSLVGSGNYHLDVD